MKYAIFFVLALGLIAAGSLSSFPTASAAIYMKITDATTTIEGDVTVKGHEKEIELNSFQFGASQTVSTSGGGGAGKATISDITSSKSMDKSSPKLLQEVLSGDHLDKVEIFFTKSDSKGVQTYAHYTLNGILISGYSVSSGGDLPSESISLNFAKILFDFVPQNPDGTLGAPIHAGWDFLANKAA